MNSITHFGQRVALLRFVMIFGIVLLHTPPYVPIVMVGTEPFELLKAVFQHAIFRTTVPMLTFISAYLLFRSGADLAPVALWRRKFWSLAVPFLIFNSVVLGGFVVASKVLGVSLDVNASLADLDGWLDAAFGLRRVPINYPLNFLRDLLVLMACAPLLGWLLRRAAWPGLILVVLVFMLDLEGILVLRNEMGILFYVGGMAATLRWDLQRLDRYAPACGAVFLAACAVIIYFRIANTTLLRLAAPLLVWPLTSLLIPTAFGNWLARMSKYSFFLFLAHAPLMVVTWLVYKRLAHIIPYPVYWLGAPVLVTLIVIGMYEAAMRFMPNAFHLMIGRRHSAARPDAAPAVNYRSSGPGGARP